MNTRGRILSNLKTWWDTGVLNIPEVQRDLVWTDGQKKLLIDSILRKYDVPKLYFRVVPSEEGRTRYDVYDGQQRLNAIMGFMAGEFELGDFGPIVLNGVSHDLKGLKFNELPVPIMDEFQNSTLDCVEVQGYSDDEMDDLFLRLQKGEPLNAAEKRRAIPGSMKQVVAGLSAHDIFSKSDFIKFKDKRYAHQDAVAKVLHQFIHDDCVSISPSAIEKTYKKHASIVDSDPAPKELKACMKWVCNHFGDPPLLKKFSFITTLFLIKKLRSEYALAGHEGSVAQAIISFELERIKDQEKALEDRNPEFVAYGDYARSDSPPNMRARLNLLAEYVLLKVDSLPLKDSQRSFTEDQRKVLWWRDGKRCKECNAEVGFNDFHADHIDPHSMGGKTSISNGRVLCVTCNTSRGVGDRSI